MNMDEGRLKVRKDDWCCQGEEGRGFPFGKDVGVSALVGSNTHLSGADLLETQKLLSLL